MAEAQTLAEQYSLKEKLGKADADTKPVEVKDVENLGNAAPQDVVSEKAEETTAAVAEEVAKVADASPEGSEPTPADNDENTEATPAAAENSHEVATKDTTDNVEDSNDEEVAVETPEIKLETAPVDFRFPTTNQSRHCFTRYIEYHRCIAAKGEGAPECDSFAKYYRALCPGEWVERWNEQRENGTFPGPL